MNVKRKGGSIIATIKDIAKLAGVSHGTASNVLNKKGNVSAEKIHLVEEAAKALGYQLNPQAQVLRQGYSNKVYVCLPYYITDKYRDFFTSLQTILKRKNIEVEATFMFSNESVDDWIRKVSVLLPRFIVCVGIKPKEKWDTVLYINFFDLMVLQHQAIHESLQDRIPDFIDTVYFLSNDLEDDLSLVDTLKNKYVKYYAVQNYRVNPEIKLTSIVDIIHNYSKNIFIISTNKNLTDMLYKVMRWLGKEQYIHIITICSTQFFYNLDQNYIEVNTSRYGREIGKFILNEHKTVKELPLLIKFIDDKQKEQPVLKKKTIKLLTIKSPMTDALKASVSQYTKLSQCKIDITSVDYHELKEIALNNSEYLRHFDMVRLDMAWLSSMPLSEIKVLNNIPIIHDIMLLFNQQVFKEYTHINNTQYALPLDVSVQMLFYRKDIFDNRLIQRKYFEKYKEKLTVPKTMSEYDQLSEFFTNEKRGLLKNMYGHTTSVSTPLVAYSDFIIRYKEKILSIPDENEAFKQALIDYKKNLANTLVNESGHWQEAANHLSTGKTVMEIMYSNYATRLFEDNSIISSDMVGVKQVPGALSLLGGGCLCLLNHVNIDSITPFLSWLYAEETVKMLAYLGGFIPIKMLREYTRISNVFPWISKLETMIQNGRRSQVGHQQMTIKDEEEIGKMIKQTLEAK